MKTDKQRVCNIPGL